MGGCCGKLPLASKSQSLPANAAPVAPATPKRPTKLGVGLSLAQQLHGSGDPQARLTVMMANTVRVTRTNDVNELQRLISQKIPTLADAAECQELLDHFVSAFRDQSRSDARAALDKLRDLLEYVNRT